MGIAKRFVLMLAPVGEKGSLQPFEVVEEIKRLRVKGVSVVHFRAVSADGNLRYDLEPYREAVTWLREGSDLLIELPCWGSLEHGLEERVSTLVLKPDLIEIIPGSVNWGRKVIYNPVDYIRFVLQIASEASIGVLFKILCPSMMVFLNGMIEKGEVKPPFLINIAFSEDIFPATLENLLYMHRLLPKESIWFISSQGGLPKALFAMALEMGGNIRVGLEDSTLLGHEMDNASLVEEVLRIAASLGLEPATPKEVSEMLRRNG